MAKITKSARAYRMAIHRKRTAFSTTRGFALGIAIGLIVLTGTTRFAEAAPKPAKCDNHAISVALPDPVSGRKYEIYVSLPDHQSADTTKRHPVLFMADGGRAFPHLICDIRRSPEAADLVVVGLSYAPGQSLEDSRRRDYTPPAVAIKDSRYGGSSVYIQYLRDIVIPFVEREYATDRKRRMYWGHSYGGLLGATILLDQPQLFETYILGSPSFWFGHRAIFDIEARYSSGHRQLPARLFMYVGGLEVRRYDPARKGFTEDMVGDTAAFEARLASRGYEGLAITSSVIDGKDHRSSVRPGVLWGLALALPITSSN